MSRGDRLRAQEAALRRLFLDPEPPLLAVEVRRQALAAVRLVREGGRLRLAAAASFDLPEGVVELSLTRPNVLDAAAFRRALDSLLERVGALEAGRAALVLPDAVLRLALVPAGEVKPRRRAEMEELVRFRLHKALPFDVRESRLSWAGPQAGQLLVAAIFKPVLESYEKVLVEAGLEPGLVEPTALALLAGEETSEGDRLLVNWDEGYVSLIVARSGWPLVVRTLSGGLGAEAVAREVGNTVLYYHEKLGGKGLDGAALRSAFLPAEEAALLLRDPIGFAPEVVDPGGKLGLDVESATAQAVAGAVSCLVGRAA
ncbi:MAG TPA: hypothetical protein VIC87_04955 [Vicinamibacteria bacterium]